MALFVLKSIARNQSSGDQFCHDLPCFTPQIGIGDPDNKLTITIDQRLPLEYIGQFNTSLKESLLSQVRDANPTMGIDITIMHENSKTSPILQVADYVAGTIQRKVRYDESAYYEIISDKIKYRTKWDVNDKIQW